MAEWRRDTPWRQGQLLTSAAAEALGLQHQTNAGQTLVVVATHDCDLAQAPAVEAVVEVIVGRSITKLDGNSTHAKTPRRLHIAFNGDRPCMAEFAENYNTFQFWLASRYRRSAFADEFERRLSETKLAEKISKALKPRGSLISGIFFDVDQGVEVKHVGPDDTYTLDIYILYPVEPNAYFAETAASETAEVIMAAFADKLFKPTRTWQHIELRSCEVVAESVLTYQQFRQLKRWRLEYISLAGDPQQPMLAE